MADLPPPPTQAQPGQLVRPALYRSLVVIDAFLVTLCVLRFAVPLGIGDEWHAIGWTASIGVVLNLVSPLWKGVLKDWLAKRQFDVDNLAASVPKLIPLPTPRGALALAIALVPLVGLYNALGPVTIVHESPGGLVANCADNEFVKLAPSSDVSQSPELREEDLDNRCPKAFSQKRQRILVRTGLWVPSGTYTLTLLTTTSDVTFHYLLLNPRHVQGLTIEPDGKTVHFPLYEPPGWDDNRDLQGAPRSILCWFTMRAAQSRPDTQHAARVRAVLTREGVSIAETSAFFEIP